MTCLFIFSSIPFLYSQVTTLDDCRVEFNGPRDTAYLVPYCDGQPCMEEDLQTQLLYYDWGDGEMSMDKFPNRRVIKLDDPSNPLTPSIKGVIIYEDVERAIPPAGSGATFPPASLPVFQSNTGELTCQFSEPWPEEIAPWMAIPPSGSGSPITRPAGIVKYSMKFVNPDQATMISADYYFAKDVNSYWVGNKMLYPDENSTLSNLPFSVLGQEESLEMSMVNSPFGTGTSDALKLVQKDHLSFVTTELINDTLRISVEIQPGETMSLDLELLVGGHVRPGAPTYIYGTFGRFSQKDTINSVETEIVGSLDPNLVEFFDPQGSLPGVIKKFECSQMVGVKILGVNDGTAPAIEITKHDTIDGTLMDAGNITNMTVWTFGTGYLSPAAWGTQLEAGEYTYNVVGNVITWLIYLGQDGLPGATEEEEIKRSIITKFHIGTLCKANSCDETDLMVNRAHIKFDNNSYIATPIGVGILRRAPIDPLLEYCIGSACTPPALGTTIGPLEFMGYVDGNGSTCTEGLECVCKNGVQSMTFRYLGPCGVDIEAREGSNSSTVISSFYEVDRGDIISVVAGTNQGGTFGSNICLQQIPPQNQKSSPIEMQESDLKLDFRPQPADAMTRISIGVSEPGEVKLSLYSLTGQQIAVIHNGMVQSDQEISYNLESYPPGIYLVRLENALGESKCRKLLIAR